MTMGKRGIDGGGEELPTKPAEKPTLTASYQPVTSNPWYRRVSLWRSVAGMAVAIALGCAAVAMEMASELSSRTAFFHHRLELLHLRVSQLRTEADDAERHLAAMRAEPAARADLNRVLSAADVVVLRLRPSAGGEARGMAAVSREAGSAIIEIAGLPDAVGQSYVMWWILERGAPAKAGTLTPNADGRLSLTIPMPPKDAKVIGVIVTSERAKLIGQPDGKIMLKGELPRPEVLS
jgi:Anti-sigma-K factor rskA